VECKNKSDVSNNRGSLDHPRITQEIPEQHIAKARNQGTAKNSSTGHCTLASEIIDVKFKTLNMGNDITCTTN